MQLQNTELLEVSVALAHSAVVDTVFLQCKSLHFHPLSMFLASLCYR